MNKQQIRITLFIPLLIFLLIVVATALHYNVVQTIKDLPWETLGSIASVILIILIYEQLKKEKDISCGTFFLELNNSISNNGSYKEIFTKLNKQELNETGAEFTIDDAVNIVAYFNFFSTVKILIKKELLKIEDIDGIYAWRFFAFMNNKFVQQTELEKYEPHCERIYVLYYDWYKFRKEKGYQIPCNKKFSLMGNEHYLKFLKETNRDKL